MTTFRVIPAESPVAVDTDTNLHPVHSTSKALGGTIVVELDDQGALDLGSPYSARLRVPVESLRSGNSLQDREMHRRLDIKRYPDITVEVTELSAAPDNGHYHAKARISVRGQTQDVEGDVTISVDADRLVVEGASLLDMRTFGIDPPRLLMLKVQPEVSVRARIVAQRES